MRRTRSRNGSKKHHMKRRGMRTRRGGMWPFDQIKGYFSGNKQNEDGASEQSMDSAPAPPVVPAATSEPSVQEEPSSMAPAGEQAGGRRRRRRMRKSSRRKSKGRKSRKHRRTRKH